MSPSAGQIAQALAGVVRQDRGRLLAALIKHLGHFQLAEDCLQDALESALSHWGRTGIPNNPQGWILQVARRRAIDRVRRDKSLQAKTRELAILTESDSEMADPQGIPDERLRLIFTCCHPALERKSRVALTLRTLGGLTTPEIARAFLDKDTAMGQRLSRAKAKISAAGISYAVPSDEDFEARLASVLDVIYLIYNEGYSGSSDAGAVRVDLCEEAIWLARMVIALRPGLSEVEGLLALMLISHGRRKARIGPKGLPVPPETQDRNKWDHHIMAEGISLLDQAIARGPSGPFQIKAAISACHVQPNSDGSTDWRQVVLLYDALLRHEPTPVVALNRAVALAEWVGPAAGLAALTPLADSLATYQPFHAARADFLAKDGQRTAALEAYSQAIALTEDEANIAFLTQARRKCSDA